MFYSIDVLCLGLCAIDVKATCTPLPGMLYHHADVSKASPSPSRNGMTSQSSSGSSMQTQYSLASEAVITSDSG